MENKIKKFFKERPAISVAAIERESGMPETSLSAVVSGNRKIPEKYKEKLMTVLNKYGLKTDTL